MSEERLKILKMLEEGKITAKEASRLIKAVGKQKHGRDVAQSGDARWLRIRVTESGSDKATVNVNLPIGLVDVGLRLGARFVPDVAGLELDELSEALRQGLTGKIIDVFDEDQGQRVEVYVE